MSEPKSSNNSHFLTAVLVIIVVGLSFVVGTLWNKVQSLESGKTQVAVPGSGSAAAAGQQGPQPQVSPTISSEKFDEIVKDAILVAGKPDAKVKLVEFSDFQCPYCGRFFSETLGQLEKEYVEAGKLVFYYRHFPLYSIHPNAENAALASECAREQGKFQEMHDMIFKNQQALSAADLKGYAAKLGLEASEFDGCLDSKKYKNNVDRDVKLGTELGVTGTPTFYLNAKVINGAQPFPAFQSVIEEELK